MDIAFLRNGEGDDSEGIEEDIVNEEMSLCLCMLQSRVSMSQSADTFF